MGRGGGGRKNLAKLVPKKKTVVDKKTGETHQNTYYVDPDKDIPGAKDAGKRQLTPAEKQAKKDEKGKGKKSLKKDDEPSARDKIKDKETGGKATKDADSDGKATKDTDADSMSSRLKTKEGLDVSKIKDFDDFGKQGVDPDVARQLFCNM